MALKLGDSIVIGRQQFGITGVANSIMLEMRIIARTDSEATELSIYRAKLGDHAFTLQKLAMFTLVCQSLGLQCSIRFQYEGGFFIQHLFAQLPEGIRENVFDAVGFVIENFREIEEAWILGQ